MRNQCNQIPFKTFTNNETPQRQDSIKSISKNSPRAVVKKQRRFSVVTESIMKGEGIVLEKLIEISKRSNSTARPTIVKRQASQPTYYRLNGFHKK